MNGPQEKPGEMSYEIAGSGAASRIKATISFEGAQCTFSGNFSDNMTRPSGLPGRQRRPAFAFVEVIEATCGVNADHLTAPDRASCPAHSFE